MKRKVHYLTLRLVFDKKCTRGAAVEHAREQLKGQDYYTTWYGENADPEQFWVRSVSSAKGKS